MLKYCYEKRNLEISQFGRIIYINASSRTTVECLELSTSANFIGRRILIIVHNKNIIMAIIIKAKIKAYCHHTYKMRGDII